MFDRLDALEARFEELNRQLMDPAIASDSTRLREVSKEHADVGKTVGVYRTYKSCQSELADLAELLDDPEMREMAKEEQGELTTKVEELTRELRLLLLPKDPYEGRNVLLEIRAGTGGDEAALFASDLFRMYQRWCDSHGFKLEIMNTSEVTVGGAGGRSAVGFKEVVTLLKGSEVYRHLKYESGVHRVQRVPLTESQGRIHTSAATVAIMPEPEVTDVQIDEQDLRIDRFRASGPGGQSVNTTDSAIRLTHLPTGLIVICQDEKSQHKNKAKAMKVLATRLYDLQESQRKAAEDADRKAQVGSGDRSERIRTYNYPQNRVTDHRVGLTLYKLDQIVAGDMDQLLTPVLAHFQAEALAAEGV